MHQQARLHLVGVVAGPLEDLAVGVGPHLPEVHDEDQHAEFVLHVADERLELVAAVRVDDDEPLDALRFEAAGHVAQDRPGGGGGEADRGDLVELLLVVAEGDGRQHDDLGPAVDRPAGGALGDGGGFDHIGAMRQVPAVRLGRAPGEHGDIGPMLAKLSVVGLMQHERAGRTHTDDYSGSGAPERKPETRNPKGEIRNPKSEIRKKSQIPMSQAQPVGRRCPVWNLGFGI